MHDLHDAHVEAFWEHLEALYLYATWPDATDIPF